MKPMIEKLPRNRNNSFLASAFRTPDFEVPWHQHEEYELIHFKEGEGSSFIGNYVGDFKTGDIFFLGSNLPHTFQKATKNMITSAIVVQFKEDFWGKDFLEMPECRSIRRLFDKSAKGLKLTGNTRKKLSPLIFRLETLTGLRRISCLCDCLQLIADSKDYESVSTHEIKSFTLKTQERIDKIFRYTIDHFQDSISLPTIADYAGMSVPAFCNYFRKSTKKTYIDFLNEIRISHACQLLIDTQKSVLDICFESGFNTIANFNKQFLKMKKTTPSAFRKNFTTEAWTFEKA